MLDKINENEVFKKVYLKDADMESGNVKVEMDITPDVFYRVLSEQSNFEVKSDADIFSLLKEFQTLNLNMIRLQWRWKRLELRDMVLLHLQWMS